MKASSPPYEFKILMVASSSTQRLTSINHLKSNVSSPDLVNSVWERKLTTFDLKADKSE